MDANRVNRTAVLADETEPRALGLVVHLERAGSVVRLHNPVDRGLRMRDLQSLPLWCASKRVNVVVETPRGASAKFAFDPKLRVFTLAKPLMIGLTYPTDWGFLPSTKAADGDALDALVVHDIATFPGLVLPCRVIGILRMKDHRPGGSAQNDRVIVVPVDSHRDHALHHVDDMPDELKQEFERFFAATNALKPRKDARFLGWKGPKAALRLVKKAERRFQGANGHDR